MYNQLSPRSIVNMHHGMTEPPDNMYHEMTDLPEMSDNVHHER